MTDADREYFLRELRESFHYGRGETDNMLLDILEQVYEKGKADAYEGGL